METSKTNIIFLFQQLKSFQSLRSSFILTALLFGALQKGSLDLELDTERITRDMAGVIEALIILFVSSQALWSKHRRIS